MDPVQAVLGIKATHLVAGVAGGTVRALLSGGGWLAAISSVVIGSLTAGYLTTPVYAAAKAYFPLLAGTHPPNTRSASSSVSPPC